MTEPAVTEQEIDEALAYPLQRTWAIHGWHTLRRAAMLASWMGEKGEEVTPGGVTITINQFNDGTDEPEPTEAELRAYVYSMMLSCREEVAEEEDAERREKDGREALRQTRDLLGRTT